MKRGEKHLKLITYILCLVPWFLSSLIPFNKEFYESLTLPFFNPPNIFFAIAWPVTYLLIAFSIYQVIQEVGVRNLPKSYKRVLLINYLANQSFTFVFFLLENTFLGFLSCIITFISSLFLYEETTNIKEKSTKYLNFYVLLSLFATVLSLTIYILNTR